MIVIFLIEMRSGKKEIQEEITLSNVILEMKPKLRTVQSKENSECCL